MEAKDRLESALSYPIKHMIEFPNSTTGGKVKAKNLATLCILKLIAHLMVGATLVQPKLSN